MAAEVGEGRENIAIPPSVVEGNALHGAMLVEGRMSDDDDDAVEERLGRFNASPHVLTLPYAHLARHSIYPWLEMNVGVPTVDWIMGTDGRGLNFAFLKKEHLDQATAFVELYE